MRQAPAFWAVDPPTPMARLLQPLGMIYGALTARRMARRGYVPPIPVICVGNLVVGGAGKTPTAIALATLLKARGHHPAILSRGYGRSAPDPRESVIRVSPGQHAAEEVGDEPLLLAAVAPTYVAAARVVAAGMAVHDGATVLILDDGLQNPALAKTFAMAVVDGGSGFGNGLCLPAGPLRAPVRTQWPFVHALCLIGHGRPGDTAAMLAEAQGIPVIRAHLQPDLATVASLKGKPLFAFAGIGRPDKFFATLRESGLDLRGTHSFPDHHAFTAGDRAMLQAAAGGAMLVTTAKDRVRLPPDFPAADLPVTLHFEAPDLVEHLLDRVFSPPVP